MNPEQVQDLNNKLDAALQKLKDLNEIFNTLQESSLQASREMERLTVTVHKFKQMLGQCDDPGSYDHE